MSAIKQKPFPMKNLLRISAIAFLFLYSGCVNEPIPCFQHDGSNGLNDQNVSIEFEAGQCSLYANSFTWNWGDSTAEEQGPNKTHTFVEPGFYIVTLTASNNSGKSGEVRQTIEVGERYAQIVKVNQIPADNAGNPWDATDDPDLVIAMFPTAGGTSIVITPENTDLFKPIPYSEDVSATPIVFTNEDWTWELRDMDGATYEVMATGNLNPILDVSDFKFTLSATDTDIEISYALQDYN